MSDDHTIPGDELNHDRSRLHDRRARLARAKERAVRRLVERLASADATVLGLRTQLVALRDRVKTSRQRMSKKRQALGRLAGELAAKQTELTEAKQDEQLAVGDKAKLDAELATALAEIRAIADAQLDDTSHTR